MTVGLPGAGIGGLFYLASALLMPVRSLVATAAGRHDEARWGLALRQSGLAMGIVGALWATGWLLSRLFVDPAAPGATAFRLTAGTVLESARGHAAATNALGSNALAFSVGTLVLILLLVQIARLLVVRPQMPAPSMHTVPRRRCTDDDTSAAA